MSAPAAKMRSPPVTTTAPGGSAVSVGRRVAQLGEQLLRQRVHLRVVERDDGDAVVASFEQHEFSHAPQPTPAARHRGSRQPPTPRASRRPRPTGRACGRSRRACSCVPPLAGGDLPGPLLEPAGHDLAQLLAQAERRGADRARPMASMKRSVLEHGVPQRRHALALGGHDRRRSAAARRRGRGRSARASARGRGASPPRPCGRPC